MDMVTGRVIIHHIDMVTGLDIIDPMDMVTGGGIIDPMVVTAVKHILEEFPLDTTASNLTLKFVAPLRCTATCSLSNCTIRSTRSR